MKVMDTTSKRYEDRLTLEVSHDGGPYLPVARRTLTAPLGADPVVRVERLFRSALERELHRATPFLAAFERPAVHVRYRILSENQLLVSNSVSRPFEGPVAS